MKKRGRGIACMMYSVGVTAVPMPAEAIIKINEDGSALVLSGATEIGQGLATVFCQIAAEETGILVEKVDIIWGDTDTCAYDMGAGASRETYAGGNAVRLAAKAVKEKLFEFVASRLQVTPDSLKSKDGYIYVRNFPKKRMSIADVAYTLTHMGKPLTATATFNHPNTSLDPETGQGAPFPAYSYATQIADVEVDTETGEVKVLKFIAAHDVGKSINPALVEGQVEGGLCTGLGYALTEEIIVDENGRNMNPNFTDYLIPTSCEMPDLDIIIVEKEEPTGPFGAKGCGEPPNCPTAPAILNAIYDAVGVRIKSWPATPERVLKAIKEKEAAENKK